MGLLGQPGDQDLVCHLILVQSSFGIYESSCQNAQEAHNLGAINAFWHCKCKIVNGQIFEKAANLWAY